MTTRRSRPVHTVFTLPLRDDSAKRRPASHCHISGEIIARVSELGVGATLKACGDSFTTLVLVSRPVSRAVGVVLPDGSQVDILQAPGDIALLPPGAVVTLHVSSGAVVIRYETPKPSLRSFANRFLLRDRDTLDAPYFGADPFLHVLSRTVRPLLDKRVSCTAEFGEYLTCSLYRCLFEQYGTKTGVQDPFIGGLSPSHKRILEEAMQHSDVAELSIELLAGRCGLSSRHLARAFRQSFGIPFHRYVMNLRTSRAKRLLLESNLPLKDIAIEIGYADQATFTESFTKSAGVPPGRYRRRYRQDSPEEDKCLESDRTTVSTSH